MDSSAREDYLEAVLSCSITLQRAPTVENIADHFRFPQDRVSGDIRELAGLGDVCLQDGGGITLTGSGIATAERVMKKHKVLQCFFHEILGMNENEASDEACILEHGVSENAISRLGDYIEETGGASRRKIPGAGDAACAGEGSDSRKQEIVREQTPGTSGKTVYPLPESDEYSRLRVVGVKEGSDFKRMIDLGIIPGEIIWLRRKLTNRAVVLQVKGCDIALSPEVARNILVEKTG
jgi:DtxR family transcriptional regulator, Mn-dependent transcriptional regulator